MNRERCIICRLLCGGGGEAEVVVEVEIAVCLMIERMQLERILRVVIGCSHSLYTLEKKKFELLCG